MNKTVWTWIVGLFVVCPISAGAVSLQVTAVFEGDRHRMALERIADYELKAIEVRTAYESVARQLEKAADGISTLARVGPKSLRSPLLRRAKGYRAKAERLRERVPAPGPIANRLREEEFRRHAERTQRLDKERAALALRLSGIQQRYAEKGQEADQRLAGWTKDIEKRRTIAQERQQTARKRKETSYREVNKGFWMRTVMGHVRQELEMQGRLVDLDQERRTNQMRHEEDAAARDFRKMMDLHAAESNAFFWKDCPKPNTPQVDRRAVPLLWMDALRG